MFFLGRKIRDALSPSAQPSSPREVRAVRHGHTPVVEVRLLGAGMGVLCSVRFPAVMVKS